MHHQSIHNQELLLWLQVFRLFSTTRPLNPATHDILAKLKASQQWQGMRSHFLACLQELVDTFPMDYYPQTTAADRQHLRAFKQSIQTVTVASQADHIKQALTSAESSTQELDSKAGGSRQDSEPGTAAGPFQNLLRHPVAMQF